MSGVARARMDDDLKNEAEPILSSVGITPSEAIRMLYKQIVNRVLKNVGSARLLFVYWYVL